MRTYILKRLLLIVPTLLGVALIVFLIMRVIPGDVALMILGGDDGGRIDAGGKRRGILNVARNYSHPSRPWCVEITEQRCVSATSPQTVRCGGAS